MTLERQWPLFWRLLKREPSQEIEIEIDGTYYKGTPDVVYAHGGGYIGNDPEIEIDDVSGWYVEPRWLGLGWKRRQVERRDLSADELREAEDALIDYHEHNLHYVDL